jgi:hypothetical protein
MLIKTINSLLTGSRTCEKIRQLTTFYDSQSGQHVTLSSDSIRLHDTSFASTFIVDQAEKMLQLHAPTSMEIDFKNEKSIAWLASKSLDDRIQTKVYTTIGSQLEVETLMSHQSNAPVFDGIVINMNVYEHSREFELLQFIRENTNFQIRAKIQCEFSSNSNAIHDTAELVANLADASAKSIILESQSRNLGAVDDDIIRELWEESCYLDVVGEPISERLGISLLYCENNRKYLRDACSLGFKNYICNNDSIDIESMRHLLQQETEHP